MKTPTTTTKPTEEDYRTLIEFAKNLKDVHFIDIRVRRNGEYEWYEGDWIKYLDHYLTQGKDNDGI